MGGLPARRPGVLRVIEGITGFPGDGKSLLMVFWAMQAMRARRPVYSNTTIKLSESVQSRPLYPEMLAEFAEDPDVFERGSVLCVDEIPSWFNSRLFHRVDWDFFYPFLQGRKRGLDLLWTAQNERRLDRAIREVTQWMYRAHRVGPEGSRWSAFRYEQYEGGGVLASQFLTPVREFMLWPQGLRLLGYDVMGGYDTSKGVKTAGYLKAGGRGA